MLLFFTVFGVVLLVSSSLAQYLFWLCMRSRQRAHHLHVLWHRLIPLKACVWNPPDLLPCLAMFTHANQSAFNLESHKPGPAHLLGSNGISGEVLCC